VESISLSSCLHQAGLELLLTCIEGDGFEIDPLDVPRARSQAECRLFLSTLPCLCSFFVHKFGSSTLVLRLSAKTVQQLNISFPAKDIKMIWIKGSHDPSRYFGLSSTEKQATWKDEVLRNGQLVTFV
jgi:hypothetical protein